MYISKTFSSFKESSASHIFQMDDFKEWKWYTTLITQIYFDKFNATQSIHLGVFMNCCSNIDYARANKNAFFFLILERPPTGVRCGLMPNPHDLCPALTDTCLVALLLSFLLSGDSPKVSERSCKCCDVTRTRNEANDKISLGTYYYPGFRYRCLDCAF